MSVVLADLAYWQETTIRLVVGLIAVLLPAGTLVYLFLFKMMSFNSKQISNEKFNLSVYIEKFINEVNKL